MQSTAQRFSQAGYNVTYFTGLLQVATPAGPVRVNGAVQGSQVYIQADNMRSVSYTHLTLPTIA